MTEVKEQQRRKLKNNYVPLLCCHFMSCISFYVSVLYPCLTVSSSVRDSSDKKKEVLDVADVGCVVVSLYRSLT